MSARPARAPAPEVVLCQLDDIPVPGSKGVTLGERHGVFVVRDWTGVHAYHNACPHIGVPLDWVPDQFLTRDKNLILCAMHGALFRVHDGYCIGGPCLGARLTPVAVAVADGVVILVSAHPNDDGLSQ